MEKSSRIKSERLIIYGLSNLEAENMTKKRHGLKNLLKNLAETMFTRMALEKNSRNLLFHGLKQKMCLAKADLNKSEPSLIKSEKTRLKKDEKTVQKRVEEFFIRKYGLDRERFYELEEC